MERFLRPSRQWLVLFLVAQAVAAAAQYPLLNYPERNQPLTGCAVPTESFMTGNGRVLATVKNGQLVTDHHLPVLGETMATGGVLASIHEVAKSIREKSRQ